MNLLVFQQTGDRANFQGRYVINHPFTGEMKCEKAGPYLTGVWKRQQEEAKNLAELTGWKLDDVKSALESLGSITLTATLRAGWRSCARYTRAIPPAPISRSTV